MAGIPATIPGGRTAAFMLLAASLTLGVPAACPAWTSPAPAASGPSPSPLGLYGVPISAFAVAAAAGFTVVHNYELETGVFADSAAYVLRARTYLEAAAHHSLRMLVGIPRAWLRERREADVRSCIRSLRQHPAVLAWYEEEIASAGDLKSVQFLAAIVQEEDPSHGLVIEEGDADRRLLSLGSARMFTYYPVTEAARRSGRLKTLPERLPVDSLRTPFWPVLQAFGRDLISGPAVHRLRVPRPDELRFSLCSAMIHGAQGIFFYPYMHATTYSVTKALSGQFAYGDHQPLPEIAPQLWDAVVENAALAARLLALTREALPAPDLSLGSVPPSVERRAWKTPAGVLVVLANPEFEPRTVRLRVPAGTTQSWIVSPLGTDPPLQVEHGLVTVVVPGPGGTILRFVPPG